MTKLIPTNSTAITGHDYNPDTRELTVQYRNGATHAYSEVPLEKYAAFTGSASPGRFVAKKVKPIHAGRKVK